jgi:LysR family transcriptional regulator, benzoate and cis,cis-muconate-responsive activator of ben and cat genes
VEDETGNLDKIQVQEHFLMLSPSRMFLTRYRALTGFYRLAKGLCVVFLNVDVRHLHAVILLAEELSFTRTAQRLRISQPALSKQIAEIEIQHQFLLFTRNKKRIVALTDAGRVFVEEARSALLHMERAFHLARAAHDGGENILMIGHSPYADPAWVSALLAIRLPLYPKLRIRLISQFSSELVRSLMAGELNLALVTAPSENSQITAVPFAVAPLYAVLPQTHAAAQKETIMLQDLANDEWILLARRVHSAVHGAILDAARRAGIAPKHSHESLTAQEAVHLVAEHVGVAILIKPAALGLCADNVVVKPLSDPSLRFTTCVTMRADDDSRLANEFARSFLRRCAPQRMPPKQMEFWLSQPELSS